MQPRNRKQKAKRDYIHRIMRVRTSYGQPKLEPVALQLLNPRTRIEATRLILI